MRLGFSDALFTALCVCDGEDEAAGTKEALVE